jgi:hypothetical protein
MKINRTKFVESLEKASYALGTSDIAPEHSHFKINGRRIQAANGFMSIDLLHSEDLGIICSVPGDSLLSLLRGLQSDEVNLYIEKENLKVKTTKLEGSFIILKNPKFVEINLEGQEKLLFSTDGLDDFITGTKLCRNTVSKDKTTGSIRGVGIKENTLFGTDRWRISRYPLSEKDMMDGRNLSIPVELLDFLIKNKEEVDEMFCNNQQLTVLLKEDILVSSSLFTEEFPNLNQYFPETDKSFQISFKDGITDTIERIITFLKNLDLSDKEVEIAIIGDKARLYSKNVNCGELIEEISLDSNVDEEFSFLINPVFLSEIIEENSILEYFPEEKLILITKNQLQVLVQTKV